MVPPEHAIGPCRNMVCCVGGNSKHRTQLIIFDLFEGKGGLVRWLKNNDVEPYKDNPAVAKLRLILEAGIAFVFIVAVAYTMNTNGETFLNIVSRTLMDIF